MPTLNQYGESVFCLLGKHLSAYESSLNRKQAAKDNLIGIMELLVKIELNNTPPPTYTHVLEMCGTYLPFAFLVISCT